MTRWRPMADPLYQAFDLPHRSQAEQRAWFDERVHDPSRRLYALEDEAGRVIGSLTLRDIHNSHSARLGITLGADYVSRGYGTEALRTFLEAFFGSMGFQQMDLDVASINRRALRCYRSLGFREVGRRYEAAQHPSYRILVGEPRYRHLHSCFRVVGTVVQVLFYDMALTRQQFLEAEQTRLDGRSAKAGYGLPTA
jgi:RimJ/RimL family protein N-acetyltransferase